ncbi:MAG: DNA-binding response regulator VicR [Candidatus Saccharibacteria bacterium]|nr:DNA-binding response regulator VicR [Candidatus Saccharibacteria bacterium]
MKKSKVLVVEDEKDLNDAYFTILSSVGYDVTTAFNGQEALDQIEKAGDPDLILLDLRMPIMDGIGFLEKYQSVKHPKTSIILFSNYEAHKEVDTAFKLGVERYILKSLASPKELLRIVESTLADRG